MRLLNLQELFMRIITAIIAIAVGVIVLAGYFIPAFADLQTLLLNLGDDPCRDGRPGWCIKFDHGSCDFAVVKKTAYTALSSSSF